MANKYQRAQTLISQALGIALNSFGEGTAVQEAKKHMRAAIEKLDEAQRIKAKRVEHKQTQHEQWWSNIVAGTIRAASSSMSSESQSHEAQVAHVKTLDQLNSMIDQEKKKLEDLELKDINNDIDRTILHD